MQPVFDRKLTNDLCNTSLKFIIANQTLTEYHTIGLLSHVRFLPSFNSLNYVFKERFDFSLQRPAVFQKVGKNTKPYAIPGLTANGPNVVLLYCLRLARRRMCEIFARRPSTAQQVLPLSSRYQHLTPQASGLVALSRILSSADRLHASM